MMRGNCRRIRVELLLFIKGNIRKGSVTRKKKGQEKEKENKREKDGELTNRLLFFFSGGLKKPRCKIIKYQTIF